MKDLPIPDHLKLRLFLFDENDKEIGSAEFDAKFVKFYNLFMKESALDFSLKNIWKQYYSQLSGIERQKLAREHIYNFFFNKDCPESNFYQPANFKLEGHNFNCSEQYFMWKKALFFNDKETADKILASTSPKEQKKLGRQVKNFNQQEWRQVCRDIMYEGVYAKFSQNIDLKKHLISTGLKINVEASPYDKIWGIGLDENDIRACDEQQWQGKNWLGQVLDDVRRDLLSGKEQKNKI